MTIDYTLEQPDFLVFQLFAASKSERIAKNRRNSRIRLPIVYFLLGIVLFVVADVVISMLFIGIGLAWYMAQPYIMKKRYIRHFEKYLHENFKNRYGKPITLTFREEFIETADCLGESKIKIQALEEVNEIKYHYFLKVSSGESIIIPKQRLRESSEFHNYVVKLARDLGIKHNAELNWEWK